MSPRPIEWLGESFSFLDKSIDSSLKKLFDTEAFSENPDYEKLARIGTLIKNPSFLSELQNATEEVKKRIISVLVEYDVNDTVVPSLFEEEIIPFTPPEPVSSSLPVTVRSTPEIPPETYKEKAQNEEHQLIIKPLAIPPDLEPFVPATEEFVENTTPPLLLINALQSTASIETKEKIIKLALSQLGQARMNQHIGQPKFNTRFKTLLMLDPSRDESNEPTHEIIRNILEEWMESEHPTEVRLAKGLYSIISTRSLEIMLEHTDVEDCEPERMIKYLRDAAFLVSQEETYEQNELGDFERIDYVKNSSQLKYILEIIVERAGSDFDFSDSLLSLMRQEGYLNIPGRNRRPSYVQKAIEILANNGSELAEDFLRNAWLM